MKITPWIIIIVLMTLLFLQRECTRLTPDILQKAETHDTIRIKGDSIPKPYPVIVIRENVKIVHDTIPRIVDTAFILQDYYSKKYGFDTIVNDSSVFIAIHYLVTQNRLIWLLPQVANKRATTIIRNTTYLSQDIPKHKLFTGAGFGRSPTSFGLTADLLLITKKENAYSISYDILNNDFYFTFYWQIRFK
jgi:hypothetical protein